MIQRDDRRGLGEAVALNHEESEPAPEGLELGIERRRTDDDSPELPAEQPVHAAVAPPSPRPVHAVGRRHRRFRNDCAARARAARRASSARRRAPRCGARGSDARCRPGRSCARRRPRPASIGGTKVAIAWPNMWLSGSRFRNRIGLNGRMYLRYFAISRSIGHDVREDVAMRDHHAFGLGRRARREDDLGGGVGPEVGGVEGRASEGRRSRVVNNPCRPQTGRSVPSAAASTTSPARMAFASTIAATLPRKSGDAR